MTLSVVHIFLRFNSYHYTKIVMFVIILNR